MRGLSAKRIISILCVLRKPLFSIAHSYVLDLIDFTVSVQFISLDAIYKLFV